MSDSSKRSPPTPSWQQSQALDDKNSSTPHFRTSDPATQPSHAELLEQAKEFLKDECIQNASYERRAAFLEKKGLQASDIEELLGPAQDSTPEDKSDELKTIYDSTKDNSTTTSTANTTPTEIPTQFSSSPVTASKPPQREIAPIITYPEFLLKPEKPPPLITIDRLINAAYAFAGISTLTYSASKYFIEPMLETLTEARLSLAETTLADLEKFNTKLESTVSHVPYIASAAALHKSQHQDPEDDNDSSTSDPTELFHRDIATQTTPSLSRTQSHEPSQEHLDATTQQVMRLSSLHETLTSLAQAIDPKDVPYLPPPAGKKLRETIGDFQTVLDKLETTYNPLRGDYYSSVFAQPADSKAKKDKDNDVAAKVRTEIRSLKGAFLSARNFPTAPRPVNTYVPR